MKSPFDAEDGADDAADATGRDLGERFARWLEARPEHRPANAGDVDLILDWKSDYCGGDYGFWTRADVDELLLDHLPRTFSASPQDAESIPSSLAAFMRFLDDEGLAAADGDEVDVVANRALAQQRSFLDAMADPGNSGMAKRVLASVGLDRNASPDQSLLGEAMDMFDALPLEERSAILDLVDGDADDLGLSESDDLPPLPFRSLPSPAELADVAPRVPLVEKVTALYDALGPSGVKLTKAGNLSLADARRLVEATGVDDKVDSVRSSAELRELFALGQVAMEARAVRIAGNKLQPVPAWTRKPYVDRWQRLVDAVVELGPASLRFGAQTPMPLQLAELADGTALEMLAMVWLADEPAPLDVFRGLMAVAAEMEMGPLGPVSQLLGPEGVERMCRDRVTDVFRSFAAAGIVEVDDDEQVTLTDAGARLIAGALDEAGFDVVPPEALSGLDAGELIDMLMMRGSGDIAMGEAWAGAPAGEGAAELVAELVARPEAARILVGFSVLQGLGGAAVEALRGALDTPIAGHAWLYLTEVGAADPEDVPRDAAMWAAVDVFLGTVDLGSPADAVESLLMQPTEEHVALLDDLATTEHPRTGDLLELFGRHHPDKAVAKHARKAAQRWRSQDATRSGPTP